MSTGPGECPWSDTQSNYMINIALTTEFTFTGGV